MASIIHCQPTEDVIKEITDMEKEFGDYEPGRWAWLMGHAQLLDEPIACKGALGLWTIPDEVKARLPEIY